MSNRYKITQIPEIRNNPFGATYRGSREVRTVHPFSRIGHYLVDAIAIQGIGLLILNYLGLTDAENQLSLTDVEKLIIQAKIAGVGLGFGFLYYTSFESWLGTSPGKMLFRRVVIDEYGERPAFGRILLRSITRWIPFEAFSCFAARGWHDRLSKTFVVDQAEADALWDQLAKLERNEAEQHSENEL